MIKVDAELQVLARKAEAAAPVAMAAALDAKLIPIVRNAKAAWPVDTGRSARRLLMESEDKKGVVTRVIENDVRWSGATVFKGTKVNVSEALIYEPVRAAIRPIFLQFAEEISRVVK